MGAMALDFAAVSIVTQGAAARQEMTGLVKKVWLLLLMEGGWWTAAEIRQKLRLSGEIHTALREMRERDFLVRRKVQNVDGETSVQYAFMRECKIPRGVAYGEIEALLEMVKGKPGAP